MPYTYEISVWNIISLSFNQDEAPEDHTNPKQPAQ